jgi:hypothetical protein
MTMGGNPRNLAWLLSIVHLIHSIQYRENVNIIEMCNLPYFEWSMSLSKYTAMGNSSSVRTTQVYILNSVDTNTKRCKMTLILLLNEPKKNSNAHLSFLPFVDHLLTV